MLVVVWEYHAKPERVGEFESFYRPDGPWGGFFRESPAFVSTTFMKDVRNPCRFMVTDRWTSESLYEDFKRERTDEYRRIAERGARLYQREAEIGRFDFLD
jgi:hypothetical protein